MIGWPQPLPWNPAIPFWTGGLWPFVSLLPGEQKLGDGWPKVDPAPGHGGRLPDAVRWRLGKEHLGWPFTAALIGEMRSRMQSDLKSNWEFAEHYVEMDKASPIWETDLGGESDKENRAYDFAHLVGWLARSAMRSSPAHTANAQYFRLSVVFLRRKAMSYDTQYQTTSVKQVDRRDYHSPRLILYGAVAQFDRGWIERVN